MQGFQHSGIQLLVLDVTDDDQVRSVVGHVLEKEGRIDILVNNAGALGIGERLESAIFFFFFGVYEDIGPIAEVSVDEARRVFEVNTFALLRTIQAVFPSMANKRSGLIVNVGSLVGEVYVFLISFLCFFFYVCSPF
jgi:1-acylglycerone phosphate reductase